LDNYRKWWLHSGEISHGWMIDGVEHVTGVRRKEESVHGTVDFHPQFWKNEQQKRCSV